MPKNKAYINSKIESEANINYYRIKKKLMWKQLVELTGIPLSEMLCFDRGIKNPIYLGGKNKGKPKRSALLLCEFFEVSFSKLFPRYGCEFNRSFDILDSNLIDRNIDIEKISIYYDFDQIFELEIYNNIIDNLSDREKLILNFRFEEETLENIGKFLNISRQRVQQIEKQMIKKIKNNYLSLR